MKSSDDYTQPHSIILLAEPGSGKTTVALQFPGLYVLDCDRNLSGPIKWLKDHGKYKPFFVGSPLIDDEGLPVPREQQFVRALALLNEAINSPDIESIFIDSATTFCDMIFMEILRQKTKKLGKFDNIKTPGTLLDADFSTPDWGSFFNLMKRIIFMIKASGKTPIFAVHIKQKEDDKGAIVSRNLAIPGQTGDMVPGWFSEVWQIARISSGAGSTRTEKRVVNTFPASALDNMLGLKSAAGIKSGTPLDSPELQQFFTSKKS